MEIRIKGQSGSITLVEVDHDNDIGIEGKTASGKTIAIRRDRVAPPLPARHPFRVYLVNGIVLRIVDPSFDEVKAFYLSNIPVDGEPGYDSMQPDEIAMTAEDGDTHVVPQAFMLSVLSATPQDEQNALVGANGYADPDIDDELDGDEDE